jgi:WhiB family redox-sensing transcriptional regulator
MQWPDTIAAPTGAATGYEVGAALRAMPGEDGRLTGTAGGLTTADVFSELELPCRTNPDLFFAESPQDVESAKALCRDCPARLACLAGAMERREPWGVWGGELFLRGAVIPRKRPRGRPRKTEVAA